LSQSVRHALLWLAIAIDDEDVISVVGNTPRASGTTDVVSGERDLNSLLHMGIHRNLAGNLEIWIQNLEGQKNLLERLAGQPIQICHKMTKSRL